MNGLQNVPTEPTGCFLDYTYCGSKNCENKCGRKMSKAIKDAVDQMTGTRISFSDFCDEVIGYEL